MLRLPWRESRALGDWERVNKFKSRHCVNESLSTNMSSIQKPSLKVKPRFERRFRDSVSLVGEVGEVRRRLC